ncbi:MAG TPA: DUF5668 domain-containing protein [Thermoanaerobaculia bacterium]|nr:DUF5668 domain-containing protein [Thermoanaerobaculia bacterium]
MRESKLQVSFGRMAAGLIVMTIGLLFLLDNLDVVEIDNLGRFWPLILVIVGLAMLTERRSRYGGPVVLVLLGFVFLAANFNYLPVSAGQLWPLALVAVGGLLIFRALRGGFAGEERLEDSQVTNGTAVMGGSTLTNRSQAFRQASLTAVMGGCELDLRGAAIGSGQAVVDVFAVMGGVHIAVPRGWRVRSEVLPLLGGVEDKTEPPAVDTGEELLVRGTVIMGGVGISHEIEKDDED